MASMEIILQFYGVAINVEVGLEEQVVDVIVSIVFVKDVIVRCISVTPHTCMCLCMCFL